MMAEQATTPLVLANGDLDIDDAGQIEMDSTIQSRAMVRLRAKRGSYYRDRTFGSRLRTIKTLRAAKRNTLKYCNEALKPLLDAGEIKRLELGSLELRPSGMILAEILVHVDEKTVLKISALPIGR